MMPFFFVTIYKVGKCMMPSVLKICSDFKSRVVYSSFKLTYFQLALCCCSVGSISQKTICNIFPCYLHQDIPVYLSVQVI